MSPLQKAGQLLNSWDIAIAAGESTSRIRVQNLQATLKIGIDAWGRSGKLQPVLISASISLQEDFETAATGDNVDHSTIHYGILSKEILKLAELIGEDHSLGEGITLGKFYMEVLRHLTDFKSTYNSKKGEKPVIDTTMVRALGIEIMLPKASLLGSGVSFYGTELFGADVQNHAYCMRLKFHDLRIATLIGVNANERLAKQMVVANVEIDRWVAEADRYVQIEQLIVMTIEESSFQTLEALAKYLGRRLVSFYIALFKGEEAENYYPRFTISLAKPTAVTFADAPIVEMLVDSNPRTNKSIEDLWQSREERI